MTARSPDAPAPGSKTDGSWTCWAVAEFRGLPLSHAADRAGVSRSHFWAILNGNSATTLDMVERLATAMKAEASSLPRDEPSQAGC